MNEKEFAEVTQFYLSNIGPLVPHIGEELGHMIDVHPVELILEALKRALEANATNKIRYADSILKSWKNQLLKTLEEVKAADQRRVSSFSDNKRAKIELVPDWYRKEKRTTVETTASDIDVDAERERLIRELGG